MRVSSTFSTRRGSPGSAIRWSGGWSRKQQDEPSLAGPDAVSPPYAAHEACASSFAAGGGTCTPAERGGAATRASATRPGPVHPRPSQRVMERREEIGTKDKV